MSIFIEAVRIEDNKIKISLESVLIIYIYKICDINDLDLCIAYRDHLKEPLLILDVLQEDVKYSVVTDIPKTAALCTWPVIVLDNNAIAGLCSVARKIVKCSHNEKCKSLLGFKKACLLACSETSVWTRFCEVDIPQSVKDVLMNIDNYIQNNILFIPSCLIKFEYHMQQPVKMHNIYKIARQQNCDKSLKSGVPVENLNLVHKYGEGLYMTLADVLLYPCIKILFQIFSLELLESRLPLCVAWFKNILNSHLTELDFGISDTALNHEDIMNVEYNYVPKESLYKSDPTRYNTQNRKCTKQLNIENSLNIIHHSNIKVLNDFLPFGYDIEFDWSTIPIDANPDGGALPKKRVSRKCEQLENLAKAIIKITGIQNYVIVDFCSGSGHLGILLATLLPNCKIILVENKEKSLQRAKERIDKLGLNNVFITQCNLDYFKGEFDIGVSLHACGVATDLVIKNCIENEAHFVCCPCCYGGIQDCHRLTYPRSTEISQLQISKKDYLGIAHAADQTHDEENVKTKQGFFCMDVIDNDRKLMAEFCGYTVHLGKLQPPSCTPKNNLLVGLKIK